MSRQPTPKQLTTYKTAALQMVANKRLQSDIKDILDEYQLNLTQWLIISRLSHSRGGQRTTDLARFMHVEVPLVTMMTRSLRTRGLVASRVQPKDKREKFLTTTRQAQKIMKAIETRLQKQIAILTKNVSWKDLQTYFKVLQTMTASPA